MKIVVVHGEDESTARARYAQIVASVKNKGWEVVALQQGDKYALPEKLTSSSLFPAEVLFTLDNAKKTPISDLRWLAKNSAKFEGSLLIFNSGSLPPTIRSSLPKSTKYEKFELPVLIWQFLDSFYPGNSKKCLMLFEKLAEREAVELVIAMLGRHLRDLFWVMEGAKGMNTQGWRLGKLKSQAAKFTKEKLRGTIDTLAEIDIKSKTGGIDAKFLLEILIIEKLK